MPSRSYGPGSIQPLPSGSYRAVIWIAGRQHRKSYPTRPLCEAWLRIMRLRKVSVDAGVEPTIGTAPNVTYRELRPELMAHLRTGARRVHSRHYLDNVGYLSARLVGQWGDRAIAATSEADVEAWVRKMRAAGLSTSSVRNYLAVLSRFHQLALDRSYIARLPCRVPRPTVTRRSERLPPPEPDFERLEAAAHASGDPLERAVLCLASDAGLRREEIYRLRVGDVRLPDGYVHVAVRGEAERTKSGRGRDVPVLTVELAEALRPLLGRETVERLIPVPSERSLDGISRRISRRAGLGDRSLLHALRHRYVTRLQAYGVAPAAVQRFVGHSDLRTTQGYTHLRLEELPAMTLRAARQALARASPMPRRRRGRRSD